MKARIIYYSLSGNTKNVSEILGSFLRNKGFEVEVTRLEPLDESKSFFGQCQRAIVKKRAKIKETSFDLSGADLICLGTPVWAFGPAPAVNTFLDQCLGLKGKKAIVFTTCGSGTGNNRCLEYMAKALNSKGAKEINRFSIQQLKVKDAGFVEMKLRLMERSEHKP